MFEYLKNLDFIGGIAIGINLAFTAGIPIAFLMAFKKILDRLFK